MSIFTNLWTGLTNDIRTISSLTPIRRRGSNVVTNNDPYNSPGAWRNTRLTGITVTEETALTLTAVYRAVSIIASTIATLPLHIYRTNQFGEQNIEEERATAFLWNRPNREMTRLTFWETVISHEVLNGNAYLFVVKNQDGAVLELWPLEPQRVAVGRYEGRKVYLIDGKIAMIDYMDGGEIVHVLNMSNNGLIGMSPIKLASIGVELAKAAEETAARFFDQDSTPNGVLSTDKELTVEQAMATAELWEQQHAGSKNRHVGVVGNGLQYQPISINPDDAQLLEQRKFQIQEIARLFGVPNHLMGDTDHASQGGGLGMEERGTDFLRFTLLRHIEAFEQAIDDALLDRVTTRRKAKFVVDGLQRGSFETRMRGLSIALDKWMTANEARKIEGYAPIEGGDVLMRQVNLAPAEQLAEVELPDSAEEEAPIKGFSPKGTGPYVWESTQRA